MKALYPEETAPASPYAVGVRFASSKEFHPTKPSAVTLVVSGVPVGASQSPRPIVVKVNGGIASPTCSESSVSAFATRT